MEPDLPFILSDSLELAGEPLLHLGTRRPAPGRRLGQRGGWQPFVRRAGRDDAKAPPILLLHGWLASAGLNWIRAFEPLGARHRVIAPDLPGHARSGPAAERHRFDIDESADLAAELLARLSPDRPAIVVGYSLGGMVAQALCRRHPERVGGLVLAATSASPVPISRGREGLARAAQAASRATRIAEIATALPRQALEGVDRLLERFLPGVPRGHWAAREFTAHDWPTVLDAGRAIAHFDTRDWLGELDVPTGVLCTERDTLIPARQQEAMIDAVRPIHVERMDAGHLACVREDFAEALVATCRAVEREIASAGQ